MRGGLITLPYLKQILRCRSNANCAQELALLLLERVAFIQMTVAPAMAGFASSQFTIGRFRPFGSL